ncbi:hypothetical protein ALO81_200339 [Pseudomonas cannabina]|uniref:Uncharacterized protein n=1 Tax=Pseudomonas cannabina TaxID=86840 RepID=A0A0P9LF80_PSECA|nr:hypothetical protein ALO81_200339 [Pseudomonas cannabina]
MVVSGTGHDYRRVATGYRGLGPERGYDRKQQGGFTSTRRPVDGQHISQISNEEMSQAITLGGRQGIFVPSMTKSRGKLAVGGQANFVRARIALSEAVEQRRVGLVVAQVVVEADDIAAEAVSFVFLEQIAKVD